MWAIAVLMWGFALGAIQVMWEERKTSPITLGCAVIVLMLGFGTYSQFQPDGQFPYPMLLLGSANGVLMGFFGWWGYYYVVKNR